VNHATSIGSSELRNKKNIAATLVRLKLARAAATTSTASILMFPNSCLYEWENAAQINTGN
jgi:hypothetical protein